VNITVLMIKIGIIIEVVIIIYSRLELYYSIYDGCPFGALALVSITIRRTALKASIFVILLFLYAVKLHRAQQGPSQGVTGFRLFSAGFAKQPE